MSARPLSSSKRPSQQQQQGTRVMSTGMHSQRFSMAISTSGHLLCGTCTTCAVTEARPTAGAISLGQSPRCR